MSLVAAIRRSWSRRPGLVLFLALGVAAQGCSTPGSERAFDPESLDTEPGWIGVKGMELTRQETREESGIAALGMLLRHHGRAVPPEKIAQACPIEPGGGSRAGRMRDMARSQGLEAYLFHGDLSDFSTELARGHPVLVGLLKRTASGAVSHYEVAVAIHPERRQIVTLDSANGWRSNSYEGFLEEWNPAGRLTLVVFPPGAPAP